MYQLLTQYTLAYLLQSDEYIVEVEQTLTERQRKQQGKEATGVRARPWLREALPQYILLDPQRAHEYGAQVVPDAMMPRAAATPRPHGRRGHWRQLRHERFGEKRRVWVSPAWVGPREWVNEGQRYRVKAPVPEMAVRIFGSDTGGVTAPRVTAT